MELFEKEDNDQKQKEINVEEYKFSQLPPIKGFPELRWRGKQPYTYTRYFPAQLKETYGHAEDKDNWLNKIFWGDNLQVMSHLLKQYRGKIDLVYIDPPFDSKADYKKTIELRGQKTTNNHTAFEEKQYGDMWNNDEYLQFMYERLILIRELLSDKGSIYLHCDWHKSHHLRCLMDEVFGVDNFKNEIAYGYRIQGVGKKMWARKHDTLLFYSKTSEYTFNPEQEDIIYEKPFIDTKCISPSMDKLTDRDKENIITSINNNEALNIKYKKSLFNTYYSTVYVRDIWDCDTTKPLISGSSQYVGYPTQKAEGLLERIIKASSNPGDLVFDCFMGSGTTQAVAMKLGRRFIGADINLGAVETTVKRLNTVLKEDGSRTGFEVYNVNNYDVFRNPVEAKALLIEALEINKIERSCFDGEKDGYMVKLMPVNRIANRQDLNEIITGADYKSFEKAREENPNKPVANIMLVCMGHEPDLGAELIAEFKKAGFEIEVKIVDILRNNKELEFKHPSEATIVKEGNKLVIKDFYPMNLLQKLSIQQENVEDWKELAECVKIDWNYDGAVFEPAVVDYPENKKDLVKGVYEIPEDAGTIKVKITDLLDESFETELDWS